MKKGNDEPELKIDLTDEMDDDWLRARRLKKALKGDSLPRPNSTAWNPPLIKQW